MPVDCAQLLSQCLGAGHQLVAAFLGKDQQGFLRQVAFQSACLRLELLDVGFHRRADRGRLSHQLAHIGIQ